MSASGPEEGARPLLPRRPPRLPSPGVRFEPGFAARVGRLVARLSAARERREGAGSARLLGVGSEFVRFRPYRPGEDLRALDWAVYARTRRPFVRVARREASEEWAVVLDTSASMGVGVPGKLQLAAEVAAAVTALGLRVGAGVRLLAGSGAALRARAGMPYGQVLRFLGGLQAEGEAGLARALAQRDRLHGVGRLLVIGDLLDLEARELLTTKTRGRELLVVQVLAPDELAPEWRGPLVWVDAESGERVSVELGAELAGAYDRRLARRLEALGASFSRRRVPYRVWSSASAFEDVVEAALG